MKILNWFLALLFTLFAAVQWNDEDPWLWIPFYMITAVLCGLAAKNIYSKPFTWTGIILSAFVAIYYFPGVSELVSEHEIGDIAQKMKADKGYIEESRESLGAIITILAYVYLLFRMKKRSSAN
jgi:uncharacterized membrane protein YfcA